MLFADSTEAYDSYSIARLSHFLMRASFEELAYLFYRYPQFYLDDIDLLKSMLQYPKAEGACFLFKLSFCFFRQPLEIRRKLFFRMLERRQRQFVIMALEEATDVDNIIEWRDEQGNTPLLAISGVRGLTHKIAKILIEHGAKLDDTNNRGETAFDRAKKLRNNKLLTVLNQASRKLK